MKINKHIEKLGNDLGLGDYNKDLLQALWNKRNKDNVMIANIARVSSNGMNRDIKLAFVNKGEFQDITRLVAKVADYKINDKTDGIKVSGCGMDMAFALIENFFAALIPSSSKLQAYRFVAVQSYKRF